jgi:hypothetical protein
VPRNAAPVVGAQGSPYLEPDQWQFGVNLKYQYSFRHFTGGNEDKDRDRNNSEVKNTVYLFGFDLTYGWTEQTMVSLSVPYQIAERSQGAGSAFPGQRRYSHANGIGDTTVSTLHWLLNTRENYDQNIGIGIGLKIPTGDPDTESSRQVSPSVGGNRTYTLTNDQSIQPGDGGWGFPVSLYAFKQFGLFTPYAYGSYLFNPQEKNGVVTGRSKPGEEVQSIPDSYLARIGTMCAIPQIEGLSLGLGLRIEGVPVRDIIGDDGGFRRPGYAISVEPQLVYAVGKDVFSLAVPWAWIRNRQRSVADQYAGGHGDAAFADYLILAGWTRRF